MTAITRVWPGHDPNGPRPPAEDEFPQLLYLGAPGPGSLVLSASREPGTDAYGNSYPAGITMHDDAIPPDGGLQCSRVSSAAGPDDHSPARHDPHQAAGGQLPHRPPCRAHRYPVLRG